MRALLTKRFILALFALSLGLAGCASGGGGGSSAPRRGSSTRISADELSSVSNLDVLAAIQRLRPRWLRPGTRGVLPGVIIDGSPQSSGGLDALRSYRTADIEELRYMSASDATTRYGTGYTQGAIIVNTRR